MLLFIDDATRYTDEYILKYKSEALENFNKWKALREKESGKKVKRFRTDGEGENTSKKIAEYLKSEGILKQTTMPYSPQSNGVVERANRTMMECVRCMLDNVGLSKKYGALQSEWQSISRTAPRRDRLSVNPRTMPALGRSQYWSISVCSDAWLSSTFQRRNERSWITQPLPAYLLGTAYRRSSTLYTIHWPGHFIAPEMWYSEKESGTQHRTLQTKQS
jgi:hypothetical protein